MRYPFLRDDPSHPIDVEVVDAGLRLMGGQNILDSIPWAAIRSIRLYCDHGRPRDSLSYGPLLYCCAIMSNTFGELLVTHPHRNHEGEVVSTATGYRAFVTNLHDRIPAMHHAIDLRVGTSWGDLLGDIGHAVSYESSLTKEATAPPALLLLSRNRPARYQPSQLPERVLPPTEVEA